MLIQVFKECVSHGDIGKDVQVFWRIVRLEQSYEPLLEHVRLLEPLYKDFLVVSLGIDYDLATSKDSDLLHAEVIIKGDGLTSPAIINVPKPFVLKQEKFPISMLEKFCADLKSSLAITVDSKRFRLTKWEPPRNSPGSSVVWIGFEDSGATWKMLSPPVDGTIDFGMKGSGVKLSFLSSPTIESLVDTRVPWTEEEELNAKVESISEVVTKVFGKRINTKEDQIVVSITARTGVHILDARITGEELKLIYETPKALVDRIRIKADIISKGELGRELELEEKNCLAKGSTIQTISVVYRISALPTTIKDSETQLMITLIDSSSELPLASQSFPTYQSAMQSTGLFNRIQNIVHSRLEILDTDILIELTDTISKHEIGATEVTAKIVAQNCRTIVQNTLDCIIEPEMLESEQEMPPIEKTRDRLSIILQWVRSKTASGKSEVKLTGTTFDYFFNYSRDFMSLVTKVLHRDSARILRGDVDQILLQLYAFLGMLFALLDKAEYDWAG